MSKLKSLNREFISNLKTHKIVTNAKRNLILSILKSTTTKREAKTYLSKYQNQFDFAEITFGKVQSDENSLNIRDNQRELFINRFLNKQNPFVNIYDNEDTKLPKIPLRLAIFKIKFPDILAYTWKQIAETFRRLVHLGISPIIMLDFDHLPKNTFAHNESYMINQTNKIMNHLGKPEDDFHDLKTSMLRSTFSRNSHGEIKVDSLELILIPLYQGIIPLVQPIVYDSESSLQTLGNSHDLLYALCSSLLDRNDLLTIEKVVMIDPIGGIPSIERNQTSHVFINLSQEYSDIVSELFIGFIDPDVRDLHVSNLRAMNNILSLASSKSGRDDTTGIITTPHIMSINNDQLNPIIYNVLTDRAVISSSLPSSQGRTPQLSTSILKKGIDVTILDADNYIGEFTFNNLVKDGLVDKDRMVHLINDSFGKELNASTYFERINESIATIVIVGDYDGAAIITWENIDDSTDSAAFSSGKVAYLDKFAIAKKNQGLPGLADIIFKVILQSHSNELIWRSRKNNPVNKWYFERCRGSISLPDSQWKAFYTGEIFNKKIDKSKQRQQVGAVDIKKKIHEYTKIVEGIAPSF
ncbi:mitochondrial amino-acid acetyltransferase [Hyphopichia burtonii NRRL Y-1933]|uniref:Amino-acid acetyltransferase, mitochondrial n=2 Tax=Dikarya TaxID=451864 RepID=A0A1E4RN00_9ASCO|nr:mitochondrial amino-acid acetyltransferase [Hyphopichia burtonii NRRL Y-1933]ODV68633.1 mitochondrial amino-acid acetyltransferase [Hyphopichia burtonii NRRL Y-1933]